MNTIANGGAMNAVTTHALYAVSCALLVGVACNPTHESVGTSERALSVVDYRFLGKLISSNDALPIDSPSDHAYAYAPSIVHDSHGFHMFYCSGPDASHRWDAIRFSESVDGRLWSNPRIVLMPTAGDWSTCDPSIVHYQAPGDEQPYYYLFYSGYNHDVQTEMFVARSRTIDGSEPYLRFSGKNPITGANEWGTGEPIPIIKPIHPKIADSQDRCAFYGAGQQTVVVHGGQLVSWYTDDTAGAMDTDCFPAALPTKAIYQTFATDPTNWAAPTGTTVAGIESVDVKYDEANDRYVMFLIHKSSPIKDGYLSRRFSQSGGDWSDDEILSASPSFPDWAHNPGASGSDEGHMIEDRALIVYGAPYDLNPNFHSNCIGSTDADPYCYGHWDLYGSVINPKGDVWNDIPWDWRWQGTNPAQTIVRGDFDHDGKADRALVDTSTSRWYVVCSRDGIGCNGAIPWGWQFPDAPAGSRPVVADYDGDGMADRAVVSQGNQWFVIYSSDGSHGSSQSSWSIPWGWSWAGVPSGSQIVVGDYDGDGKADRALVTPGSDNNKWYVIYSSTGSLGSNASPFGIPWGWSWSGVPAGSQLVVADYDGDGKADRALVTPSSDNNKWYVIYSSTGSLGSSASPYGIPWGWGWAGVPAGSQLVVADYDGDGKVDRALLTPAADSNKWYIIYSSTGSYGSMAVPWGMPSSKANGPDVPLGGRPVVADYDGDGKADLALIAPAASYLPPTSSDAMSWYVFSSHAFQIY